MSKKSGRIAALIQSFDGQHYDPHYLGYFDLFNRGLFYESHDVLEELWLPIRKQPDGAFYKGLIQLAGAFVHLQKNRLRPAAALFKLAVENIQQFPDIHQGLEVPVVLELIKSWQGQLEALDFQVNPLSTNSLPKLLLR